MVFRFAGFELDQHGAELRAPDGGTVKLRPKTLEMLRLFAANPGRALSKQVLIEAVWPKVYVSEDSLFQCIRELRAALGDDRRQIIKLVSGGGYVLTALNQGSSVGPASAVQAAASLAPFSKGTPPLVAVLPIVDASDDPRGAAMATEVTAHLTDGFARIDGIRVVAPRSAEPARHQSASASSLSSDFEVHGELRRDRQSWAMRARMIRTATGEIQAIATVSVDASEPDGQLQQSRLAAGAGYPLARRLNELLEAKPSETPPATGRAIAYEKRG